MSVDKNLIVSENKTIGQRFECFLWGTRWAILLAVICSVCAALVMFYVSAVDTFYAAEDLINYHALESADARAILRADAVGMVVKVIDIFLLAIVLLIFGLGLYELYISKIDHAYERNDESAVHMLSIKNLDDLKSRLGKVIMMILVVKFFEMAIGIEMHGVQGLLTFAAGVLCIAMTLFVTERMSRKTGEWKTRATDREDSSEDRSKA
ncbi:YqhA family protein [Ghiorsea bivora]|uniref:YqhA family protein n=1 Tax=Ghiorsea bivora TaxID=1485545 RepID=UPI00056EBA37|nr:YqhA family protein [Ghiorsea bivora]